VARADLHIHTRSSDGLAPLERVLEHVQALGTLDLIAITDHEDARPSLRAREIAARRGYSFAVVPGAEITTIHGHLVALFIENTPRSFRSLESTIEAVHRLGGLAIVPHPMSWATRSVGRRAIERVMARTGDARFDGIEVANPSPAGTLTNAKAARLNQRWRLPQVGASDAHHLCCVGAGWTEFEGSSPEDLRRALASGTTIAAMCPYPSWREIGLRNMLLQLAWGYAATPRKILGGSRGHAEARA
jgi:predicted metal-dependent phosphoesterase TrpH